MEESETEALKEQQRDRERSERRLAETTPGDEAAQHEARAAKAEYLRAKLEERERAEREAGD
jgi:hypothetical protein